MDRYKLISSLHDTEASDIQKELLEIGNNDLYMKSLFYRLANGYHSS